MTMGQYHIMRDCFRDGMLERDAFVAHFRGIDPYVSGDVYDLLSKDRYDLATVCAFARLEQGELASLYGLSDEQVAEWCVVSNRRRHQAPACLLDLIAVDTINERNL